MAQNSNTQTDREMFWVMKYFLPLLLFAGVGAPLARNYSTASAIINRLLLDAPFLLWGVFLLTVAEVRATHSRLEFRRFYKWRQMPYAAIRQCAPSLHPGLGFIELNEFRSRIYFVTLRPCLMMFLLGVIYSVFLTVWFPNLLSESNWNGSPPWMSIPMIFLLRAGNWPWALLTAAILIAGIMAMRFQKRAWALAMVVGSLVGHVSIQVWR